MAPYSEPELALTRPSLSLRPYMPSTGPSSAPSTIRSGFWGTVW